MSQYKTVAKLKDSVSGILQGLNLNNVKNLNVALERTARQVSVKLDIPEAMLTQTLTLYDGVTDYASPTNIFGTEIVDIQPQGTARNIEDYVYKKPIEQFDREKSWQPNGFNTTFQSFNGLGVIRIVTPNATPRIELDPMTATTGWATGGSASGLLLDNTVFWQEPGALRFNLAALGSQGYIEKTIPRVDLTQYQGVGVVFVAVRLPSATAITSIGVHVGTNSSNYFDVSSTTGFLFSFQVGEWMLIAMNLANATQTGTVTITDIEYVRVYVNYNGTALTNVYMGDVFISLPYPTNLLYQSNAIFLPTNGLTPLTTITNDADTIQLNDAALAIYEIECAIEIAQQQGGTLASGSINILSQKLNGIRGYRGIVVQLGLYDLYRADNPSQSIRSVGSYYDD